MRTATKLNRNEPVPTKDQQWEFADLSRVRSLLDIACSSGRAQFSGMGAKSGKWSVESTLHRVFRWAGGNERNKESTQESETLELV